MLHFRKSNARKKYTVNGKSLNSIDVQILDASPEHSESSNTSRYAEGLTHLCLPLSVRALSLRSDVAAL